MDDMDVLASEDVMESLRDQLSEAHYTIAILQAKVKKLTRALEQRNAALPERP